MSSLPQYNVSNDVIVVENNNSSVEHWNPFSGNNWNDNVPQQPEIYQQIPQCLQQTQEICPNVNTQLPYKQPNPVYENLIEDIAATICYQDTNSQYIPPVYNQSGNFQGLLQNRPMMPSNQIPKGSLVVNSHPRPYPSHSIYVNAKTGLKAVTKHKRKRKRTMFTTEQVAVLEKVFLNKPYINREERQALVEELQINDRVIKVWFQNRRLKEKREAEEAEQELYSPDAEAIETKYQLDELSYIESQINRTDKFGFVTLDDRAMNALVSVIDNLLSKEIQANLLEETCASDSKTQMQERSEGSTMYEPISPASSDDSSSEASTSYEPFEPKESLQRIFDIQEFLVFNQKTV